LPHNYVTNAYCDETIIYNDPVVFWRPMKIPGTSLFKMEKVQFVIRS
jgi:hypothetical protein